MKHLAILSVGAAVALLMTHSSATRQSGGSQHDTAGVSSPSSLTVLYTASATGQIRSCNCTKFRFGGYGRELTLLKSIRAQSPDVILIEGGDTCGWTGFQAKLKAEITASALKLLKYDAMIPGEEELGVRGARYIDYFDPDAVPIVCANIFNAGEDEPAYRPYVILTTNSGLKIAVIGLMDVSVEDIFVSKRFTQVVKEPSDVLPPIVEAVREKVDLVFVVYHASADKAEELAAVPGVDLILATHRSDKHVSFPSPDSNRVEEGVEIRDGVVYIEARTRTNWSLGVIDLKLDDDGTIAHAEHALLFLDRRYEEDPDMVTIYEEYNEKVKKAVLVNSEKLKKDTEARLLKRGFNVDEMRKRLHRSPFATAEKCRDCHSDAYESWKSTGHASAITTLEKTNQDYDPECVSCHATGVFVRHGFRNRKDDPELVNVQCEACHGPGLDHARLPLKDFGRIGEQMCLSCHTEDQTPDFDFDTAWARIKH